MLRHRSGDEEGSSELALDWSEDAPQEPEPSIWASEEALQAVSLNATLRAVPRGALEVSDSDSDRDGMGCDMM
jgi:hypothetical protein